MRLAELEIVGNGDVPLCALAVVNVYVLIRLAHCFVSQENTFLQVAERASNAFDLRIVTNNGLPWFYHAVGMLSIYLTFFRCVNI